jgi:hypothetical protein
MEQPNETNCSRIIMTDYLSSRKALEKVFPSKSSIENKIFNMLAEKSESLKLIWVPAHTEIERNEAADEAAKDALNEDILPETKVTEMYWKRWLKNAARRILENEWMTSENAMVQVKPNMKKIKRYSKSFTSRSSWGGETENGLHQNNSGIQTG